MQPADFLKSAKVLVGASHGRPIEAHLRRAQSSIYYAMFHCLARNCADTLIGGASATRSTKAWRQAYRALGHKHADQACKNGGVISKFPDEIRDFANTFRQMQFKRELSDYDPMHSLTKNEVNIDIGIAEAAMQGFKDAPIADRRAFCAFVVFPTRRENL